MIESFGIVARTRLARPKVKFEVKKVVYAVVYYAVVYCSHTVYGLHLVYVCATDVQDYHHPTPYKSPICSS